MELLDAATDSNVKRLLVHPLFPFLVSFSNVSNLLMSTLEKYKANVSNLLALEEFTVFSYLVSKLLTLVEFILYTYPVSFIQVSNFLTFGVIYCMFIPCLLQQVQQSYCIEKIECICIPCLLQQCQQSSCIGWIYCIFILTFVSFSNINNLLVIRRIYYI